MSSLKSKLSNIPQGAGALFFIQMFSTLGFAVLYSSLVLYASKHLHFSTAKAAAAMGIFGAFNYGLHLFGGYLGGRFLSNRNLFVGGMVLQVIGCACIAGGSTELFYWGLALFLTGSGLNVTCINMMLTQRFKPEDIRREGAFLWNYAGMNVGFFVGFTVAGYYQLTESYASLFIFATLGNFMAIVLASFNWKSLVDLNTPLLNATPTEYKKRFIAGIAILLGLVPVVWYLLQSEWTENLVKTICLLVAITLLYLTIIHKDKREKNNMWAYLILTLSSLVFWSLYQMAPNGLQLFAVNNVDLVVWGHIVAPQWIQNINTVTIVFGGPLMSALFVRLRAKGWNIDVPKQFSTSLILMGLGFLALPLGILFADDKGMVPFFWLFLSYVLQSIGELLISPVGYAMIGRMAPRQYQGIMMGSWMLITGVASLFAGDFSGMIPEPSAGTPLTTNADYSHLFSQLGWGTVAVGVVLVVLIPFLRKLIKDKEAPEVA
ncbi:peptide MFS transporter [Solimicrobium silvestre]|uniref:Amino acid/peptide transporter (Peptide:H+ symporter) n=1 Tax=Solimicrobium silvestre TaxID=2099400 RepID=A0A2S9H472_9BURK|nr:oligopeptide:H+ symporter [Solimicrobium silvestre]PRC94770.1 Amino acid/peptide transporter (Peptide:H+ symporter) [Solimicrobium silvestre]